MPASKEPVLSYLRERFAHEMDVTFELKEGARIAVDGERLLAVRDAFADDTFLLQCWKTAAPEFSLLDGRSIRAVPPRERRPERTVVWKSFEADRSTAQWICEAAIRHELSLRGLDLKPVPTADREHLQRQVAVLLLRGLVPPPPPRREPAPRIERGVSEFVRDPQVAAWVLQAAAGCCERCDSAAPFFRKDGIPYLELHHVKRLADGGPDSIDNVVAICPNCHRHLHHAQDAGHETQRLYSKVARLRRVDTEESTVSGPPWLPV